MTDPAKHSTAVHDDVPLDIAMADGPDRRPPRPRLTVATDLHTRAVVGWTVSLEGDDVQAS